MAKGPLDKRIYEIRARLDDDRTFLLAISADATLVDLHLALLGASDWRGSYSGQERGAYHIELNGAIYTGGRGSRTRLRSALAIGTEFTSFAVNPSLFVDCIVENIYTVESRRHYPKVVEYLPNDDKKQEATWRAQGAVQRDYRRAEEEQQKQDFLPIFTEGFLTGLVAGPMLMPGQWIDKLLPEESERTLEGTQSSVTMLLGEYNRLAELMHSDPIDFADRLERFLRSDKRVLFAWNRGFLYSMTLAENQWRERRHDADLSRYLQIVGAVADIESTPAKQAWLNDEKFYSDLAHAQSLAVLGIADCWRRPARLVQQARREGRKVGPNEPCPCGSSKKYKRCCSPLRVLKD